MKVSIYKSEKNTGVLNKTPDIIDIKRGLWIKGDCSHPLVFVKKECFKQKYVYFLFYFGNKEGNSRGVHITLKFWENIRFLWMQRKMWIHKKEFIMWLINISIALPVAIKACIEICCLIFGS